MFTDTEVKYERKEKGKKLLFFEYVYTVLTETGLIFVYSYNMLNNNTIIEATLHHKRIYTTHIYRVNCI